MRLTTAPGGRPVTAPTGWTCWTDAAPRRPGKARRRRRARTSFARQVALPPEDAAALRARADASGVSTGCVLLAAAALLDAVQSGDEDVVLALPLLGRAGRLARHTPSMATNEGYARVDLLWHRSVGELIHEVSRQSARAVRHQRYRYETLRRELLPHSGDTTADFARLAVNVMSFDQDVRSVICPPERMSFRTDRWRICRSSSMPSPVSTRRTSSCTGTATCTATTTCHVVWPVCGRILGAICACGDDTPLAALTLTDAAELSALSGFNATAAPPVSGTLPGLLSSQALRHAELPAVVFGDGRLSYGELEARSNRLARELSSRGAGPETVVAVGLGRSLEMVVAVLAVLKSGAAYLPLDVTHPRRGCRTCCRTAVRVCW